MNWILPLPYSYPHPTFRYRENIEQCEKNDTMVDDWDGDGGGW